MIPRYSRPEMVAIWSPETRFRIWFEIEAHACDALAELGVIPKEAAQTIWEKGGNAKFNVDRIDEIERETKHDVIAFLTHLAEFVGPDSRFIHQGMTSSDVLDTCLAVQLKRASDLLIADLEEMVANWQTDGEARATLVDGDASAGLTAILTGLGSLSYGELAGERMKLGLLLHDPEEEHDCFSDNTHDSHLYDAVGIRNVYLGEYKRVDGSTVSGPSLSALVAEKDSALDEELRAKLDTTVAAMEKIAATAAGGEAYDQMIGEGNETGNATVQAAIDALIDQTRSIERVIAALELDNIELEGSDSLDNPNAVFQ